MPYAGELVLRTILGVDRLESDGGTRDDYTILAPAKIGPGTDSREACLVFLINHRAEVTLVFRIANREIRKWGMKRGILVAVG